jgi:hypothetical protein
MLTLASMFTPAVGPRRDPWPYFYSRLRHYATSRKVAGSIPDEVNGFFSHPKLSSPTMTLGSTHPLTEMSISYLPGSKGQPAHKADNLTSICEPIVYKMWETRRLKSLRGCTASYRDSVTCLNPHDLWRGASSSNLILTFTSFSTEVTQQMYSYTLYIVHTYSSLDSTIHYLIQSIRTPTRNCNPTFPVTHFFDRFIISWLRVVPRVVAPSLTDSLLVPRFGCHL